MSKKKTGGKTSIDKDLEGISFNPEEVKVEVTTKYLSNLEKKGAVVNGEPVPHKELVKTGKHLKLTTHERSYLIYLRHKQEIKNVYLNNKNWDEVIGSVFYSDVDEAQEALIDYIEEVYNIKVKDAKHLYELTGITQEVLKSEPNIKPGKETTLENILIAGKYSKYARELVNGIAKGLKYEHLLRLEPKMFGLPETWKGNVGSRVYDKYTAILWAIGDEFDLMDMDAAGLSLLPSLRAMANELKAPYSVLMDAFNTNSSTPPARTLHYKRTVQDIKRSIDEKILDVLKKQSKTWRKERGLDDPKEKGYDWTLNTYKNGVFLVVQQLASNKISKITGRKHKPHIDYAEDYLQFVEENFSEEINSYVQHIIHTAYKGNNVSKEVQAVINSI